MRLTASVAVVALSVAVGGTTARAQIGPGGTVSGPSPAGAHTPPPLLLTTQNLSLRGAAEHAMPFGDWFFTPGAYLGAIYDTNPEQSEKPRGAGWPAVNT